MKKFLIAILVVLILSACGGAAESPPEKSPETLKIEAEALPTEPETVLADTFITACAYVDSNNSGGFDDGDAPLSELAFVATLANGAGFGEKTLAGGCGTITIPGGSEGIYPATITLTPPAEPDLEALTPLEVVLETAGAQAIFLFQVIPPMPKSNPFDLQIVPENALARLGRGTPEVFAFSPDGSLMAIGGTLGVWVYDTASLDTRFYFADHTGAILALDWSPDGKYLASGAEDAQVIIWDMETGLNHSILPHLGPVEQIAWSPVGQRLAVYTEPNDGSLGVFVWDVFAGVNQFIFNDNNVIGGYFSLMDMVWSPSGDELAVATGEGQVTIWDTTTGTNTRLLNQYTTDKPIATIEALTWQPDGSSIAVGWAEEFPGDEQDRWIMLWDPQTGVVMANLQAHSGRIMDLAWAPDGSYLASAGTEKIVLLWDFATQQVGPALNIVTSHAKYLRWSLSTATLFMGLDRNEFGTWSPTEGYESSLIPNHFQPIRDLAWSHDQQTLSSLDNIGQVILWDTTTAVSVDQLDLTADQGDIAWSPTDNALAISRNTDFDIWNTTPPSQLLNYWDVAPLWVKSLTWSPDGSKIAAALEDRDLQPFFVKFNDVEIVVWDADTEVEILRLDPSPLYVNDTVMPTNHLVWSPDGTALAATSQNGDLILWDATDGAHLATFSEIGANNRLFAWDPTGSFIAVGTWSNQVLIVDTLSGDFAQILDGFEYGVAGLTWSANGTVLAVGNGNGGVHIWDATTWMNSTVLEGHADAITVLSWSPDSEILASGSRDGTIIWWDFRP